MKSHKHYYYKRTKEDNESSFEIEHNGMSEEDNLRFSKRPKITVLSDLSRGAVEKFMYAYKLYCRISWSNDTFSRPDCTLDNEKTCRNLRLSIEI